MIYFNPAFLWPLRREDFQVISLPHFQKWLCHLAVTLLLKAPAFSSVSISNINNLIGFLEGLSEKTFVDLLESGKCAAHNTIITIVSASHALLIYGHTLYRRAHVNKQARSTPWASQEFRMFGGIMDGTPASPRHSILCN